MQYVAFKLLIIFAAYKTLLVDYFKIHKLSSGSVGDAYGRLRQRTKIDLVYGACCK
ncbi:hypothetical protein [uncultured Nostoc sp.]|uniref:hypothetical protein n=1 Tax=uncultured Nostoc sp. TaxID=340711 RepID=UPI00261D3403|nr:hypothetical protein [uncultured Nostoc sp.]